MTMTPGWPRCSPTRSLTTGFSERVVALAALEAGASRRRDSSAIAGEALALAAILIAFAALARFAPVGDVVPLASPAMIGLMLLGTWLAVGVRATPAPVDGRRASGKAPPDGGCSSMVEQKPSKLTTRVRFPSPAPAIDRPEACCSGARGISDAGGMSPGGDLAPAPASIQMSRPG